MKFVNPTSSKHYIIHTETKRKRKLRGLRLYFVFVFDATAIRVTNHIIIPLIANTISIVSTVPKNKQNSSKCFNEIVIYIPISSVDLTRLREFKCIYNLTLFPCG